MCAEAAADFLAAVKPIPDMLITSKMIQKLYGVLYTDENILYFKQDSGNITFCYTKMVFLV